MDISKLFKRVNIFKNIVLILIFIFVASLVGFTFDILFIEKYKMNLSEIIILCISAISLILLFIDILLINKSYKNISSHLSSLSNDSFDMNAIEASKLYKESLFVSPLDHVVKNLYKTKIEGNDVYSFDVIFIKDANSQSLAHMYVYNTSETFKEHYYMNHALFVKGFENFKLDSNGNTNLYHFISDELECKKVGFTSNFYIAFKGNTIYFIDFNKKMFNIEKDLTSDEMFTSYLNEKKDRIEYFYDKLMKLK